MSKPGLLTLTIKDKAALYLAYMPFVRNGGLFIPTNNEYQLGDEVFMPVLFQGEFDHPCRRYIILSDQYTHIFLLARPVRRFPATFDS